MGRGAEGAGPPAPGRATGWLRRAAGGPPPAALADLEAARLALPAGGSGGPEGAGAAAAPAAAGGSAEFGAELEIRSPCPYRVAYRAQVPQASVPPPTAARKAGSQGGAAAALQGLRAREPVPPPRAGAGSAAAGRSQPGGNASAEPPGALPPQQGGFRALERDPREGSGPGEADVDRVLRFWEALQPLQGEGAEQLAVAVVRLMADTADDGALAAALFEMLGDAAVEFISGVVQERRSVLESLERCVERAKRASGAGMGGGEGPGARAGRGLVQPAFGQIVTVKSETDRAFEKLGRREARRKKRAAGMHSVEWLEANGISTLLALCMEEKQEPAAANPYETEELDALMGTGDSLPHWTKTALAKDAKKTLHAGWEEVFIPAKPPAPIPESERRVAITELDAWAQKAFKGYEYLNRIQSRIFETAYFNNDNVLVCAPTGAGKTNIAMLTVLHEVRQNLEDGALRKDDFKIVYVAPMKALAAEVTATFSKRLEPLQLQVRELTGDMQLTKQELQQTQMIVTTPEKWDVVTRKGGDVSAAALVRLLIIDEVHLLNDERGAVIEALVARTKRQVETAQSMIRIVGLSATLPNYKDVASFLGVNPESGLFFFDGSYRPVPLDQTFIGVTPRNFMERNQKMNEICFKKAVDSLERGHQVMVFVHARKETVKTGRAMSDMAQVKQQAALFDCSSNPQFGVATKDVGRSKNRELQELFPHGIGVHHAGMLRSDRSLTERLFRNGLLKILVCTATLAWGVNLPAHTVVIKGTQYYDPSKGAFVEISILDVMQIFGRAGRPQFDTSGEANIITTQDQLSRYISLATRATPIESQFSKGLVDNLNAELVLGTVTNTKEACAWLGYTYLSVRMRKNPLAYGLPWNVLDLDPTLQDSRQGLVVDAARTLSKRKMAVFDERSGNMYITELGRIASHFYLQNSSIETYNERLKEHMSMPELLEMISLSSEFENIKAREDEVLELERLGRKACNVDVRGGAASSHGKVNILLQSYISYAKVEVFSLVMDMAYVGDNAPRITRALFELCLRRGWCSMADMLLGLCKGLERRVWPHSHPLYQMPALIRPDVTQKLEERGLTYDRLYDMSAKEIGAALRMPHGGGAVRDAVESLPQIEIEASVQPITRSVLRVVLTLWPVFRWKDRLHGNSTRWVIWVEDQSNEHIYHNEFWSLGKKMMAQENGHKVAFTIPIFEPLPPQYYVRVISDSWLGAEAWLELSLKDLILPERHPPHTELLDLTPLPRSALQNPAYEKLYEGRFTHFNPIQTQAFHVLHYSDHNVLMGAPTGSGKTVCSELAILRAFSAHPEKKVVYIAPLKALVRERVDDWRRGLCRALGKRLVELTGDFTPDMRALMASDLIVATPEKWDGISRNWKTRSYVRQISLLVIDEIHLLGQDRGPALEVIISRMRHIAAHTGSDTRFVGLSTALSNARDLADWLGIPRDSKGNGVGLYNFRPSVRPVPLEAHIQGYPGKFYCPRMATMNKPAYAAIQTHSPGKPVLIFVSSRRQTRLTALDLIAYAAADDNPSQFVHMPERELCAAVEAVRDSSLKHTLQFGIGLHHAGLREPDRKLVERLYVEQKIQVLVATSTLAWGVNTPTHLVIIKGTEFFDAPSRRYVDFPITDVLQMMGRAGRPQYDKSGIAVIMVHEPKKSFYKKFLYEPFPVESSLPDVFSDHLNAEIVSGAVRTKQDIVDYLTWTFFFRRVVQNPSYYNLEGTEHSEINEFLSTMVEDSLNDLVHAGCVELEDDSDAVHSTPMGRVASDYYLKHLTLGVFSDSMHDRMEVEELLHLLCAATEYDETPVRHNEDEVNLSFSEAIRAAGGWAVDKRSMDDPHTKVNLLLQAHFCRLQMPMSDYVTDLKGVLDQSSRILQAIIDVACEKGWLTTALNAMVLVQMIAQSMWHNVSSCMVLPGVDESVAAKLANSGFPFLAPLVESAFADARNLKRVLQKCQGLSPKEREEVSRVCNRLPVVQAVCSTSQDKDVISLEVECKRLNAPVKGNLAYAPKFPKVREESLWLVVGDGESNELLAMKRVPLRRQISAKVTLRREGLSRSPTRRVTLFLVHGSYLGLDQEISLEGLLEGLIPRAEDGYGSDSSDDSFWLDGPDDPPGPSAA